VGAEVSREAEQPQAATQSIKDNRPQITGAVLMGVLPSTVELVLV
jgi:hypothetical protein